MHMLKPNEDRFALTDALNFEKLLTSEDHARNSYGNGLEYYNIHTQMVLGYVFADGKLYWRRAKLFKQKRDVLYINRVQKKLK